MSDVDEAVAREAADSVRKRPRGAARPLPSFGPLVASAVDAARASRQGQLTRIMSAIATQLERAGDETGAATVRAATADQERQLQARSLTPDAASAVEWHDPGAKLEALILPKIEAAQLERLAAGLHHARRLAEAGIDPPSRVLFAGESGTGKTLAALTLGARLGLPVAVVRAERVVSQYLGETAGRVAKCFDEAASQPSIIFLDEVDAVSTRRADARSGGDSEMARGTSALLQRLDALPPTQLVVAATNLVDRLDTALLRRLPTVVRFSLPDLEARQLMVDRWVGRVLVVYDLNALAAPERSGALLRAAAMERAREVLLAQWEKEER